MPNFALYFSVVGEVENSLLPSPSLLIPQSDGSEVPLRQLFVLSSGSQVRLSPRFDRLSFGARSGLNRVTATDLQGVLNPLLQNPAGIVPVPNLGVLLAATYGPRESVSG